MSPGNTKIAQIASHSKDIEATDMVDQHKARIRNILALCLAYNYNISASIKATHRDPSLRSVSAVLFKQFETEPTQILRQTVDLKNGLL